MDFSTVLELSGRTATGLEVPEDVLAALGGGRRPAVRVTIGSYTYRTTIGSMNGRAMIPVSAEHREACGIEAGQTVVVRLEPDTEERTVDVPEDLAVALSGDPALVGAFDALSVSRRKALVFPILQAKGADTRQRRVLKAVESLRTSAS
ncbi:YdeI/OmpD-associated family protein [Arthrobacter burdickii]|uniref:YdeI/OmpD-associated family protein n=1 Tax=Arthrobacter burdickii TaxID=3035920 RepID=A0ABT8K0N2_9MICC|nr:YdeI/OmpD-associated family protein [Arthrobacter burdickii]MDN4610980.1 YdeI/OmpD-associated family protein [Arthrobacter burdickii]